MTALSTVRDSQVTLHIALTFDMERLNLKEIIDVIEEFINSAGDEVKVSNALLTGLPSTIDFLK
jgi:hypothetical protein